MNFLQTIPYIENSKIVNSNILYSDTLLDTKTNKGNLCLATKNNVSIYTLEEEIENIIKKNIEVVFHIIQYDEKNKRLYFYTNEELVIEVKQRTEDKTDYIKELSISEYYKKIIDDLYSFKEPKEKYMLPLENESTVSLKRIIDTIVQKNKEMKRFINNTNATISESLNFKIYLNNNKENKLFEMEKKIPYGSEWNKEYMHIYFEIIGEKVFLLYYDNDDLNTPLSFKYLKEAIKTIKPIIEESSSFLKYTNNPFTINSINSNYQINISKDSLEITISDTTSDFNYTINFDHEIKTECKSFELYNLITSNKINEIFNNIYFCKKHFPEWMQEEWEKKENNNIEIEEQEEKKQKTKKRFFNF